MGTKRKAPAVANSARKLQTLDLFSGLGGMTLGLSEFAEPLLYCDVDPTAQQVLVRRMSQGQLPPAPIHGDVQTLRMPAGCAVDMLVAGFPCQDISRAGFQSGIDDGLRSGLFREVLRLADETRAGCLFLENVENVTYALSFFEHW